MDRQKTQQSRVVVREADAGEMLGPPANRMRVLANSEETEGGATVIEFTAASGFGGPPPHVHEREDELLYVVEGELLVRVGDEQVRVGSGGFVLKPRGVVHGLMNPGTSPARFIEVSLPGGIERYFRAATELAREGNVDPGRLAAVMRQFGIRVSARAP